MMNEEIISSLKDILTLYDIRIPLEDGKVFKYLRLITDQLTKVIARRKLFYFKDDSFNYFSRNKEAICLLHDIACFSDDASLSNDDLFHQLEMIVRFQKIVSEYNDFSLMAYRYLSYSNSISTAMTSIAFVYNNMNLFDGKVIDDISSIREDISRIALDNELSSICEMINSSKDDVVKNIAVMKDIIDRYNKIAKKIWFDFTLDPRNNSDNNIRYLVHDGLIKEGKYAYDMMSSSLITENELYTYGDGYGMIIIPKDILAAGESDLATDNSADISKAFGKMTLPIKLPQEIELACSYNKTYSEIVVNSWEIAGIFLINRKPAATMEIFNHAKMTAKKLGIPLVIIDEKTRKQKIIFDEKKKNTR